MAKAKRVDSTEWKQSRPPHGSSSKEFKEWSAQNPNRVGDARRTEARMTDAIKKGKAEPESSYRYNASGSDSKIRQNRIANWQGERPVSGKGGAKSDEDKANKRQQMIDWAAQNPNRMDNARVAQGKKASQRPAKAKKAPVKKASPMKKGKKK